MLTTTSESKTDKMLAMEASDPKGRDIRQIIVDAYEATGTVKEAAKRISDETGIPLAYGLLHDWIEMLGGHIAKRVVFKKAA